MEEQKKKGKREWKTPAYQSLKFSKTLGGGIFGLNEDAWSTTIGGTRDHGTIS